LPVAAALLFSRDPGRLRHPELWAEDGLSWLVDAYNHGAASLVTPHSGYLQTISRLGAYLVLLLPFTAIPLAFALLSFVVQLAPAALLLSRRSAALIPSLPARLVLAFYYLGVPNAPEVYVNLTNAMWHLALVAFLLIVLPKPPGAWQRGVDILVLVLAGVSGPFSLLLAPVAWWHAALGRRAPEFRDRTIYAIAVSLCAIIQAGCVVAGAQATRIDELGASFNRLVHIVADQVLLGGIVGSGAVDRLMAHAWWMGVWPAAVVCLVGLGVWTAAWQRGPPAFRQFTAFAVLLIAAALASPVGAQWGPLQTPSIGGRYFLIPMLAWIAAILVLAARPCRWGGHWLARLALCACLIGVEHDWRITPLTPTGYQTAARTFDAAPAGTVVVFPENPVTWTFALTKH
jgi:hypothetical protein